MKSDVVVGDCWWTHEFMFRLLLSYVVDANSCFGYCKLCCYDQVIAVFLSLYDFGENDELSWIMGFDDF